MEQDDDKGGNGQLARLPPAKLREVMPRNHPPHAIALVAAIGSLSASAFAICTGIAWPAIPALLLMGIALLLPAFFDYRQTRRALEEAQRPTTLAQAIEQPEIKRLIEWPDSSGHTIH